VVPMDERSLIDQLDRAVETIIAHPGSISPPADLHLAALVAAAEALRDLPGPDFRKQLRLKLEREAMRSKTKVDPVPAGYHTITAYVSVPAAVELIDWCKNALGFKEHFRTIGSAVCIHCELRLGDSMLMIGGGPMIEKPAPTAFHVVTNDVDAMYRQAMNAGARSLAEPTDQPYGERVGGVQDLAGNDWYFAKAIGDSDMHRGLRALNVYLHPAGAPQLIQFLKAAFDAEEVQMFTSPEGVVHHAKIRIGDSILEMGEAHERYQPMPTKFYLYVPDCDGWYDRSLSAGARSISEPKDQPYGDRSCAVEDPYGNTWYIATRIEDVS